MNGQNVWAGIFTKQGTPSLVMPATKKQSRREREARLGDCVTKYSDMLARLLLLFGTPHADVDDALQEVLLVFARRQDEVLSGKERAFLIRTAKFVALRHRTAVRRLHSDLEKVEAAHFEGAGPDLLLDKKKAIHLLGRILKAMPSEQADIYVLFEVEELSSHEIAELLEVPRGTVVSRLRAARREVDRRLRQEGFWKEQPMDEPRRILDSPDSPSPQYQLLAEVHSYRLSEASRKRLLQRARSLSWLSYLASPVSRGTQGRLIVAAALVSVSAAALSGTELGAGIFGANEATTEFTPSPKKPPASSHASLAPPSSATRTEASPPPALVDSTGSAPQQSNPTSGQSPSSKSSSSTDREVRPPRNAAPTTALPKKTPETSNQLEQEIRLVDQARAALRANQVALAMAHLNKYSARFAAGNFSLEVEAMRIEGLLKQGRLGEGRERARSFISRYPGSTLARRVESLLGEK